MANVKLGNKIYENVETVKLDTADGGTVEFADRDAAVEAGKQEAYDKFWDAHQNYGKRTEYHSAFVGLGWNAETFKPKYDIVPTGAMYMFAECGIIDLVGALEACGAVMDFSKCRSFNYMLSSGSSIKHFPPVDLSSAPNFLDGFRYAVNLESASLINVQPAITWGNSFINCSNLVDITFSGTIGNPIAFSQSSELSAASVDSVISALADLTGQTAKTVSFHGTVGANMTEEQKAAITAKNWTLVY